MLLLVRIGWKSIGPRYIVLKKILNALMKNRVDIGKRNFQAIFSKAYFSLIVKKVLQERLSIICNPYIKFFRGQRPKDKTLSVVTRVQRCFLR